MSKNENTNRTELFSIAKKKSAEMLAKSAEVVSDAANKTYVFGKKAMLNAQSTFIELSDKAKNEKHLKELKKWNPVFPGDYASETFHLPNIIVIRDDAVRKDIEVCNGAVGWLEKTKEGVEIFCLYDEFVDLCGLHFIPSPERDVIYYVDHFDRSKFIRIDKVFQKAHEEKIAELRHIAYCLGAKSCTVHIRESEAQADVINRKSSTQESTKAVAIKAEASAKREHRSTNNDNASRYGETDSSWSGDQPIVYPELKWFRHEETILKLIDSCMDGNRHVKSESLILEGSSVATMSQRAATSLDIAASKNGIAVGTKNSFSMASEASKEHRSKLFFHIEF